MQHPASRKTRLFSPEPLVADAEVWLDGEQAKYVTRVLRLRKDDEIIVFDGEGGQYPAVIKGFDKNRVLLQVGPRRAREIESPLAVHLIQGISRGARMDAVVQKSTELGVHRITPVVTEHTVVRLDAARAERRHEHWLKVSRSACEQCGRNTLPRIDMPQQLDRWLRDDVTERATRIVLAPGAGEPISSLPAPRGVVELLVGPEGGLSEAERSQCREAGFTAASLGPRTLRTETAALAGIAIVQALWGDM